MIKKDLNTLNVEHNNADVLDANMATFRDSVIHR